MAGNVYRGNISTNIVGTALRFEWNMPILHHNLGVFDQNSLWFDETSEYKDEVDYVWQGRKNSDDIIRQVPPPYIINQIFVNNTTNGVSWTP